MASKPQYTYNRRRVDLRSISNAVAKLKLKWLNFKKSWYRTNDEYEDDKQFGASETIRKIRNHPLTGQPKTEADFWVMENYK